MSNEEDTIDPSGPLNDPDLYYLAFEFTLSREVHRLWEALPSEFKDPVREGWHEEAIRSGSLSADLATIPYLRRFSNAEPRTWPDLQASARILAARDRRRLVDAQRSVAEIRQKASASEGSE